MSEFGKIGSARVEIFADTKRLQTQMAGLSSKIKQMGRSIQNVGRTLTRNISLPLGAAGVATSKFAADFETEMTKINSLVGESSGKVEAFKEQVKGMAGEVGKSPEELAEALFFVTSAGLEGSKAMDTLEASAKASAAGMGETKQVADAATSVMNAYGAANINAESAVDTLVATVREGKVQTDELAGVVGQIVPITSELNIGFDEVGGALATMTRKGLDASKAATSLRGILRGIIKPSEQGKKRLKEYGTSMEELRKIAGSQGLLPVLEKIKGEVGSNEEALTDIFPRVRGLIGVLSLVGDEASGTQQIFENVANSSGSMDRAFGAASETITQQFMEAWSGLQSSMIEIGKAVAPVLIDLFEDLEGMLSNLADRFKKARPAIKETIVEIAMAAVAAGPALTAIGTAIVALGTALGALATPGGLGIAAAVTFAAAKVSEMWDTSQSVFKNLQRLWATTSQKATKWFGIIRQKAMAMFNSFTSFWKQNKGTIISFGDQFVSVAKKIFNWFNKLSPTTKKYVGFLGGLLAISPQIVTAFGTMLTAVTTFASFIGGPATIAIATLAGAGFLLVDNWGQISNTLEVIWLGIQQSFEKMKQMLLRGLAKITQSLLSFERTLKSIGLFEGINNTAKKTLTHLEGVNDRIRQLGAEMDKASKKAQQATNRSSTFNLLRGGVDAATQMGTSGMASSISSGGSDLSGLTMEADGRQIARVTQEHQTKEAGKRGTTVDL